MAQKEHQPWHLSYQKADQVNPSWARHGMPKLFPDFLSLVKAANLGGIHLDVGCGNGVKTVVFAKSGLKTLGIDQSKEGFGTAIKEAQKQGVLDHCSFVRAHCTRLPVKDQSVGSVSDILMLTHLRKNLWLRYQRELNRVLQTRGYLLLVTFSDKDEHFHGHQVSKSYHFEFDPQNQQMAGFEHYHGMYNIHFSKQDIDRLFVDSFRQVLAQEVDHPVYPHRKLWNVILQKL